MRNKGEGKLSPQGFPEAMLRKSITVRLLFTALILIIAPQAAFARRAPRPGISYKIHVDPSDLSGFSVEMRITGAPSDVRIAMASHPEYDDRYWRYVENLSAESGGKALTVTREEDALWSVRTTGGELIVKYRINLSPQTAQTREAWRPFLTPTGGLIGDLHSLMYLVGAADVPARVTLDIPDTWAIASGLDATNDAHTFYASSVELLLDSPILIGHFRRWDFKVNGVPHTVAYFPEPNTTPFDTYAFIDGIQRIVSESLKIFGRPPYSHYTFIFEDGPEGALEHLNSVTIGASSHHLSQGLSDVFQETAHEYFHTWNLMHVRPTERVGLRYRHAEPTRVLWWSEGVTMYYSDLLLRRARLPVEEPTRVAHLENKIATYLLTPGYQHISPERASLAFDDPLALGDDYASVYLQGELLGTMLDLLVREKTGGRLSLDDVMRTLSERFTPVRGITDSDIERAVHDVCRCDAHSFFEAYVRGARAIDFDSYLQSVGLRTEVSWSLALDKDGKAAPDFRIYTFSLPGESFQRLRLLNPASVWGRAGLHTGDRLISIDGHGVARFADFRSRLAQLHIGETTQLEVMRAGAAKRVAVTLTGYDRPTVRIREVPDATPSQLRLRAQWADAKP